MTTVKNQPVTNNSVNRMPSRMGTSVGQSERPMTSNKAAGYSKTLGKNAKTPPGNLFFQKKENLSKEQIIKDLEKTISKLLDESVVLKCKGDFYQAKDKCLVAMDKLQEFRKKNPEYFNSELEFGIKLNLGLIYQYMNNLDEAKAIYSEILKNESHYIPGIQVARVRVNIGNIHFKNENYKEAIKEYQKAYDKINKENKDLKANISRNIGLCYIRMVNFEGAIDCYNSAVQLSPDVKTTMNLLLCQLTTDNNKEQIMKVYNMLLDISTYGEKDAEPSYTSNNDESKSEIDVLKEYQILKKKEVNNIITTISLILTNYLDKKEPMKAFDLIIDCLKKNGVKEIVSEMEMAKAMYFLKKREVEKTIKIMKAFENKDKKLISRVSNNVSFIYFIEGDMAQAENYVNVALENERYNHKALVNKGNIYFYKEDYLRAKDFYLEAIGVQSDCVEAIYNLGMINERMEAFYEALQAYDKLNTVLPNIPEVLYKLGRMNERLKDYDKAIQYYTLLLGQIPNDPVLLSSMGNLYYSINVGALVYLYFIIYIFSLRMKAISCITSKKASSITLVTLITLLC